MIRVRFLSRNEIVENLIECSNGHQWKAVLSSTSENFSDAFAISIEHAIEIAEKEYRNWSNFGDEEKEEYWGKAIDLLSSVQKEGKNFYVMSSAESLECFVDNEHWIIAKDKEEAYEKTILKDNRVVEKMLSVIPLAD